MSEAAAYDNFIRFSDLLELTLEKKVMPKRRFENVAEFELHTSDAEGLIFDGTENATERPQNHESQKSEYSGKKKVRTDVAMILPNRKTRVYYVSELYDGNNVDMGMLKKEFPVGNEWFKNRKVLFDLGFVGVQKAYEFKELIIGKKKPRKSKGNPNPELTGEQKEKNREISQERIFVEHAIGKMKIFHALKNKCRTKCRRLKKIIGICAGLWNYRLSLNN